MRESAALSFLSNVHELVAHLAELRISVESQIETGTSSRTIKYLFLGRTAVWYGKHHSSIVTTARSCAAKNSALASVSQITFSAYKSSSGLTELTKSSAFRAWVELLPAACRELGNEDLGRRAQRDFESIMSLIDGCSEKATGERAAKRKHESITTAQMQQADALYEQLLSTLEPKLRHEMRQQTMRADNKLAALMKIMQPS